VEQGAKGAARHGPGEAWENEIVFE